MNETTPNPLQETAEQIRELQSTLGALQTKVRLQAIRDELGDLNTTVSVLGQRATALRAQGYAFEKGLEDQCSGFFKQWMSLQPQILEQVDRQASRLDVEAHSVEFLVTQAAGRASNPPLAGPMIAQARSSAENVESQVDAAERTLRGMYDAFANEIQKLTQHLDRLEWTYKQIAEGTFKLLPTESAVMAVSAVWVKYGKEDADDPKGVLYLTDQRLIFEQKQEVATKKFLFITTEKQKVQQLQLEAPVALIQEAKPTKRGLFGNEDHLDLLFASGAPCPTAHFHINGQDCNEWQGLIGRARSKDYDRDRAVAIEAAEIEKVKKAPSQCPACGGAITQPVLRGMDALTCPYCGNVIRL